MAKSRPVKNSGGRKTTRGSNQGNPRFAHPYFSSTPPEQRARMLDHIKGTLRPIPPIKGTGLLSLADIIGNDGASAIKASGKIVFHVAGDTGVPETDHETRQVYIADAMAKDFDPSHAETSPAFFLHVGDVIYGSSPASFLEQFYRPYMHYPGKIIAIPGNHDGESDSKMGDFQKYFCSSSPVVPPIAGSIFRETMTQPGVYWCLDAPFVQIVGLYSNAAENPGFISGPKIGSQQKQWLVKTLKWISDARKGGSRKALLIATHHPPYSGGGHSGSTEMLQDIDDACNQAGLYPDAFFSGHAHSLQRHTRAVQLGGKKLSIPYIVTGCGGHGGQTVQKADKDKSKNPVFDFSRQGWGYTKVEIDTQSLVINSYGVDVEQVMQVDTATVPLT